MKENVKTKPAQIVYGRPRNGMRWVYLRAGALGRGRVIQRVREWGWSTESRQCTHALLYATATREGFHIVEEDVE